MNKVVIEEFQHLTLSDPSANPAFLPCLAVPGSSVVGADHQMLLQSSTRASPRMRSPPPPALTADDDEEDEELDRAVAFMSHLSPRKRPFARLHRFYSSDPCYAAHEYRKEQVKKYIKRTSGEAAAAGDGEAISKRVLSSTARRLQKRRRRRSAMYKNVNGSTSSTISVHSASLSEPIQSADVRTACSDGDEPESEQRKVRFAV
jgi:hypothetical protein